MTPLNRVGQRDESDSDEEELQGTVAVAVDKQVGIKAAGKNAINGLATLEESGRLPRPSTSFAVGGRR